MVKYYRFADSVIEIDMPEDLAIPDNMTKFEIPFCRKITAAYRLTYFDGPEDLKILENRMQNSDKVVRKDMIIYRKDDLECRWIYFGGSDLPYAVCQQISETETVVYVMRDQRELFVYDTIFASVLAFERHALRQQNLLLHCAFMNLNGQAILFSAPSGTGKSTQAELWEKYRGTRQINGDAALLGRTKDRWTANGWTVCGSSEICHNESYPIRAIVMLFQSKENSCRKLSAMEAFKSLYPRLRIFHPLHIRVT